MRKQNLTEEIYRMRKLMNFDSKEYRDNITSLDRLIERKILTNRLNEEEEPPKFHDWTKKGKFNWDNAKFRDIIKYVEEVDAYIVSGIESIPAYEILMSWYSNNDSQNTRDSLRAWLFGDIYYGIDKVAAKETKKNIPDEKLNDKKIQDGLPQKINNITKSPTWFVDLETKIKNIITDDNKEIVATAKKHLANVKKEGTLEKISKEITALNKGNVLIPLDELTEYNKIITNITNIIDGNDISEEALESLSIGLKTLDDLNLNQKKKLGFETDDDYQVSTGGDLEKNAAIKRGILKKAQKEFNSWGVDPKKILKKCDNIRITDEPEKLTSYRIDSVKEDIIIKNETEESDMFNYPPTKESQEKRDNLGNNFFADDGTILDTPIRDGIRNELKKFSKFIKEKQKEVRILQEQYPKYKDELNLEILSFNVFTFASTSKVRTRYKSKDRTFSEDNNIKLAEDRCDVIYNFIKKEIEGDKLGFEDILEDVVYASKATKPNIGPGWKELDGVIPGPGGTDIKVPLEAYGKLFQEAHKIKKEREGEELTPQKFYGSRTDKWAKKASELLGRKISQVELSTEYEEVYGPFRMNLAGFNATVVLPEVIDKSTITEDYYAIAIPGMGIELNQKSEFDLRGTIDNLKRGLKKIKRKTKNFFRGFKPLRTIRRKLPKFSKVKDFRKILCPKW